MCIPEPPIDMRIKILILVSVQLSENLAEEPPINFTEFSQKIFNFGIVNSSFEFTQRVKNLISNLHLFNFRTIYTLITNPKPIPESSIGNATLYQMYLEHGMEESMEEWVQKVFHELIELRNDSNLFADSNSIKIHMTDFMATGNLSEAVEHIMTIPLSTEIVEHLNLSLKRIVNVTETDRDEF